MNTIQDGINEYNRRKGLPERTFHEPVEAPADETRSAAARRQLANGAAAYASRHTTTPKDAA